MNVVALSMLLATNAMVRVSLVRARLQHHISISITIPQQLVKHPKIEHAFPIIVLEIEAEAHSSTERICIDASSSCWP